MTCPPVNSSLSVLDNSGAIVPTARIHFRDVNYPGGRRTGPIAEAAPGRPRGDGGRAALQSSVSGHVWLVIFSTPLAANTGPKIRTLIGQCLFLYGRNKCF